MLKIYKLGHLFKKKKKKNMIYIYREKLSYCYFYCSYECVIFSIRIKNKEENKCIVFETNLFRMAIIFP